MDYRLFVPEAGSQLVVRHGSALGVSRLAVGFVTGDEISIVAPRTAPTRNQFIRIPFARRGLLESVLVAQVKGSAPSFTVMVYERISDGFAIWNAVFRSATVVMTDTEIPHYYAYPYGDPQYGYGYTEFEVKPVATIEAIGLMAPFQNRETTEESEAVLYLAIVPTDASEDNEFEFRLSAISLQ